MAIAGWTTEPTGALNYQRGEYDSCLVFTVMLGIPIWFSVKGYVHVIDQTSQPGIEDRLERVKGCPAILPAPPGADLYIPLRASRDLGWMAIFYALLWMLGIAGFIGLILLVLPTPAERPPPPLLKVICVGALAAFGPLLWIYRSKRAPSVRQERIREVISKQIGPSSDVASWEPRAALSLQATLKFDVRDARSALESAQQLKDEGMSDQALLAARLAIALSPTGDAERIQEAERITDACLKRLQPA